MEVHFLKIKYSYEDKLKAVLRIIDDGMSTRESARLLGTSPSNVRMWKQLYLTHGPEALKYKRTNYDSTFKVAVIEYMHQHNLSQVETAVHFGITQGVLIGMWEKQYNSKGYIAFAHNGACMKEYEKKADIPKKTESLEEEVLRLRMENEYLKKLQALVQKRISRENGKEQKS